MQLNLTKADNCRVKNVVRLRQMSVLSRLGLRGGLLYLGGLRVLQFLAAVFRIFMKIVLVFGFADCCGLRKWT